MARRGRVRYEPVELPTERAAAVSSEPVVSTSVVQDGTPSTVDHLVRSMLTRLAIPLLQTGSDEEQTQLLTDRWQEFYQTANALVVVVRQAENLPRADASARLEEAASRLRGDRGRRDARFAILTRESARRLANRFSTMRLPDPAQIPADWELYEHFADGSAMDLLGCLMILVAPTVRPTSNGISCAFELLRQGSLLTYVSVRGAYELRRPPREQVVELPYGPDDFRRATEASP